MHCLSLHFPTNIYLFKVAIETLEKGVKYVDLVLVFSLLTLNIFNTFFTVSIVDFEQTLAGLPFHSQFQCRTCPDDATLQTESSGGVLQKKKKIVRGKPLR